MFTKFKQKFNDIPLRTKLLVLLFVAGILPLLFVSVFSYSVSRKQLIEQAYTNIDVTNRQIASNIDDQFTSALQTASVLSQDSTLLGDLSQHYTSDWDFVQAYRYIDHTLYNVLSTNTKISNICLYIGNQTLPSDGLFIRHLQEVEPGELAWLQAERTRLSNVVFRGVTTNKKGEPVVSLGCVLNLSDLSYPQGYLVMDLKESAIFSLYEKEAAENNIYIVDAAGHIQSTKEKALLAQPLGNVLGPTPLPEGSGTCLRRLNGRQCMVMYCELLNGWRAITVTPLETVYGHVNEATASTVVFSLFCILAALVLILYISRYFSSRFRLMNDQIQRIENNNFAADPGPFGKDEMGRLQAALAKMARTLDDAINETYIKEVQRKDAELTLLQSQINPHLLYNSLSGITSLALSGRSAEVADFTKHLSQFYKSSLNQGKRVISIQEEINITKHYIAIQNTRFRGMFHFTWQVDDTLLENQTLKLILQPFVENIVNHAVKDDDTALSANISIQRDGPDILFALHDEGVGISPDKLPTLLDPSHAAGYGITNVNDRIKLQYGPGYGVSIRSVLGAGTTAFILIPDTSVPEHFRATK